MDACHTPKTTDTHTHTVSFWNDQCSRFTDVFLSLFKRSSSPAVSVCTSVCARVSACAVYV